MHAYLAFSGVCLIAAGFVYLLFPHVTGVTGMQLPGPAAAIDARASYGGVQIGLGVYLLWCRLREEEVRAGLVLICVVSTSLALARVYGFACDGGPGWFNALAVSVESGFAGVGAILLRRRSNLAEAV